MRNDDQEERTLPASDRKLKEARKKGQVAVSRDVVGAAGTLTVLLYIWLGWDHVIERLTHLIGVPADTDPALSFARQVEQATLTMVADAAWVVGPPMVFAIGMAVVFGIASTGGLVVAFDLVTPKFERLNPAEGFKKLLSLRHVIELVKMIVKALLLLAASLALVLVSLDAHLKAPACGLPCVGRAIGEMVSPFIGLIVVFLIATSIADLLIQRSLFLRDMRMSATEAKRERKDMEGDPEIRRVRKDQLRAMVESSTPLGVEHATLLVVDDRDLAIALRYHENLTPVPVVVARGVGKEAAALRRAAAKKGLPIDQNPELAVALSDKASTGAAIPRQLYDGVSLALIRHNLV